MTIPNHLSQLFVDVIVAIVGFFKALAYSFVDADARAKRFQRRRGRRIAAWYTRSGMFKRVAPHRLVMIDALNGDFVAGDDAAELTREFEQKFGARRLRYLHLIKRHA
jgi:hypothetical protein